MQTIWIYRYYDPTSKTYDRPGGRRFSIEEAADGLRLFIEQVKDQTKAPRVYLIAHSMGGLVCRSLLQKIYLEKNDNARNHVDKLFTYGTPHSGIRFVGGGVLERVRDALGVNDSNVFGPDRMYQFLTPGVKPGTPAAADFVPDVVPDAAFDIGRIFCIVGTNAKDYEVAGGLSRSFLLEKLSKNGTMRYMVRLAVFSQTFERGFLSLRDHIERLPVWSDYMIVELRPSTSTDRLWDAFYAWASDSHEPHTQLEIIDVSENEVDAIARLPAHGLTALGSDARITFRTYPWS